MYNETETHNIEAVETFTETAAAPAHVPVAFDFELGILKAAALACSTEATRYYLNGVAIEWNGKDLIAVATDGHRLAAFKIAGDFAFAPFSYIIPHGIIKGLKVNKRQTVATFRDGGKVNGQRVLSIEYNGATVAFNPIDGTFPDWRRVIPSEFSGETAQFNPHYLASFADMKRALGDKGDLIAVKHNGGSPALVSLNLQYSDIESVCVIMPFRGPAPEEIVKPVWA